MAKRPAPDTKLTRDDLEQRFAAVQSGMRGKVASRKATLTQVGSVAAIVIVVLVYVIGKRSGKRKTTLVEIRRV